MTTAPLRHRHPDSADAHAPAPGRATDSALRYRLGVVVRAVAAIGGGYAMAALAAATLALYLPGPRVDNVLTGSMAGLVVLPCTAMWAFAARSALRAWLVLLPLAAALATLQALAPVLLGAP